MTCRVALNIAKYAVAAGATHMNDQSDEETDEPLRADDRNFYKVEKWTRDGMRVDSLLYAGNSLSKAQEIFANAIKHRPKIRITIRQRTHVLQRWPQQKWRGLTRAQDVIRNKRGAKVLAPCGQRPPSVELPGDGVEACVSGRLDLRNGRQDVGRK